MPTQSQDQHPYLQNLPENELQALTARCHQWPPDWASASGEDMIGPWAEIHAGNVVQRLRYVPAGKFMMGAPPEEEGRQSMEGPQHLVTISQGFWMADTACTQALWEKVMGENPSRFTEEHGGGPECPVENVNWFRVQAFLQNLEQSVPGCHITLPTEAEWEYACRAGSQTAFSFGANITPGKVNYNGTFPYGKAAKGEYRERTVPVKALPANAWGLYQMHGNVVEWCADELRIYQTAVSAADVADVADIADIASVTDPGLAAALNPMLGNQELARVLRGGSWFSFARLARSAFRIALRPDWLYVVAGFRLVVRVKNEESGPQA